MSYSNKKEDFSERNVFGGFYDLIFGVDGCESVFSNGKLAIKFYELGF